MEKEAFNGQKEKIVEISMMGIGIIIKCMVMESIITKMTVYIMDYSPLVKKLKGNKFMIFIDIYMCVCVYELI